MKKCLILGAGAAGLGMAGILALSGYSVTVYNRSKERILPLINDGLNIVFPTNEKYHEDKIIFTDILQNEEYDFIFFCLNSNAQEEMSKTIYKHYGCKGLWLLIPGHTFGAIAVLNSMGVNSKKIQIMELQALPFVCRIIDDNTVKILQYKKRISAASYMRRENEEKIKNLMKQVNILHFDISESNLWSSMNNVTFAVQPIILLLNAGRVERTFHFYSEGSNRYINNLINRVDEERILIAQKIGVENALTSISILKDMYGVDGNNISEVLQNVDGFRDIISPNTLMHRFIIEHVETGMVPIESVAEYLGLKVPNISSFITIASSVVGVDLRENGRNKYKLGLTQKDNFISEVMYG